MIAALAVACLCPPAFAQTQAPLSVIDWLGTQSNTALSQPPVASRPNEPPVAKTALAPDVSVQNLEEGSPREIGLVPTRITGLPTSIWAGSDLASLTRLITALPDPTLPAAQSLLYTILLAEAAAPGGKASAGEALALARVEKLVALGALDPAQSLIEQAGVTTSSAHFDLWMQISLLTGTEDRACAVLTAAPHLTTDYGSRIFCDARARNWDDAALTFGSAQALGLMPPAKLALIARFLDPEAFEAEAALTAPREMDPLSFRLFETIGEPIPTGNLPRAYAVADLRDLSGWKAQIEAAERLTRAGALPDNRLLGLYTDRKPAASGGVWDRVAALQRFETALGTGSTDAVTKTLPAVWTAMAGAGLEVPFASLFADAISPLSLEGRAGQIALDVQLLSAGYEGAATRVEADSLPAKIALGSVPRNRPNDVTAAAIYDAFDTAMPRSDLVAMVKQDRLGEAMLHVLSLLHRGTQGNARALTDALATLRALGLEDTARRAAIQSLLLER